MAKPGKPSPENDGNCGVEFYRNESSGRGGAQPAGCPHCSGGARLHRESGSEGRPEPRIASPGEHGSGMRCPFDRAVPHLITHSSLHAPI